MKIVILIINLYSFFPIAYSLDNGVARTPPMGWMSWTKFYCETNCAKHPFSCINQQLYMDMADRLAVDGYREAGYEYVHIDDCWMERSRDTQGKLVANLTRFPSGIRKLSEYMHSRGLKLGIYEDIGTKTCAGYPGSYQHYETDAQTFADWKVDYLKVDGCNIDLTTIPNEYPKMGIALNRTGRQIVYSCSWPAYLDFKHEEKINYTAIGYWCNLWRNFDDIYRSWGSVLSIIDFYNKNQEIFRKVQAPGRWNDPDMLIVGNTELTVDQAKVQMSVWAIWSAPLIMSNDLRTIVPEQRDILLNRRVIAVDQDPLGIMGRMVFKSFTVFVYTKEMTPVDYVNKRYSYAVAVVNHGFLPIKFSTDLKSIGLTNDEGYSVQCLWSGKMLGDFGPSDIYNVTLAPTSVAFMKATLPTQNWQ
uniref:Alpha-galactosidase n=1 Tax=Heterodera avenae TaxID=34510 RepID=A0A2L0VDK5_HETAV|nr:putative effector protein [Heterodera avenae]